ncbi:MAG: serine/threonine protein kinase, partial [Spirochaetales bacterium]|nr:serine/threonine protein kinase [Spirochaetales bacterium]
MVISAIEQSHGVTFDGTVTPYPSYTNRVYGLRTDTNERYVAKFYRPGRWSREAILDEHAFIADCADMDVPVAVPVRDLEDDTLCEVAVSGPDGEESYRFALFPQMGGRNFDAESDKDYYRLGAVVGRCHAAGKKRKAEHRVIIHPELSTRSYLTELLEADLIHPGCREEFESICSGLIETITPLFDGTARHRLHGDCHRGNILDRGDEGLLIFDFDDMANGPPVQDLWLLLPDYVQNSRRALNNIIEGYTQFCDF